LGNKERKGLVYLSRVTAPMKAGQGILLIWEQGRSRVNVRNIEGNWRG